MLAEAALYGLPVGQIIATSDPVEQDLWLDIVEKAREHADEVRKDLARKIANAVWGSLKVKGKGK
jgi:hypothetical protein